MAHSLLDWSFMTAADANLQASRTSNNVPNRASSWGVLAWATRRRALEPGAFTTNLTNRLRTLYAQ